MINKLTKDREKRGKKKEEKKGITKHRTETWTKQTKKQINHKRSKTNKQVMMRGGGMSGTVGEKIMILSIFGASANRQNRLQI